MPKNRGYSENYTYPSKAPKARVEKPGYPRETLSKDPRYSKKPFPRPYDSVGPAPFGAPVKKGK